MVSQGLQWQVKDSNLRTHGPMHLFQLTCPDDPQRLGFTNPTREELVAPRILMRSRCFEETRAETMSRQEPLTLSGVRSAVTAM